MAKTKSDIKVLVVAHNPSKVYNKHYSGPLPNQRRIELANKRGEEYIDFLSQYFSKVDLVYSDSYSYTLSDKYDVTILDDLPAPIDTLDLGIYRNGKSIVRGGKAMMYPRYLPEDFNRALIVMGDMTDDLTYMIPSKFMTQCHCIQYGYGFNTNTDHIIFNSPIKVNLEYNKVHTPKNFKKYYSGKDLPDEIDVWWAQTESAGDSKGYWIGQILVGLGFDDSPGCEFITSSNSVKDISGMALGRNANMFHWGFSASPAFMTEQAKKVFVNTIHYMSQFNEMRSITNYKANSRLWANEFCYKKTHKLLDLENEYKSTGNAKTDSTYLYYKNNHPYFYGEGMSPILKVDEDAKSLGIANNDIRILEKCIQMLARGNEKNKVLRILHHYTEFDFTTAREWKNWYEIYKDYLFFSELGGYKFIIDTYNHPELNQRHVVSTEKKPKVQLINSECNNEDEKLQIEGKLLPKIGGNYTLELCLNIKDGWHIYADMPDDGMFIKTKIDITIPSGINKIDILQKPKTQPYQELDGVTLYKGEAVFKQELLIDEINFKEGQIVCSVYYQACNDYMCAPPVERQIKLRIKK